jgi:cobalt-precorrin-5B (C1)-methyltransferase
VLKHMKRAPVERLSVCGGFGKLSKLAAGHLDLHSRNSSIDLERLAAWSAEEGADNALQAAIRAANTSQQAVMLARAQQVPLGDIVCRRALAVARDIVPPQVKVEMFAIDRQGNLIGVAR